MSDWVAHMQDFAYIEPSLTAAESTIGVGFKNQQAAWRELVPEYEAIFQRVREVEILYCYAIVNLVQEYQLPIVNYIP